MAHRRASSGGVYGPIDPRGVASTTASDGPNAKGFEGFCDVILSRLQFFDVHQPMWHGSLRHCRNLVYLITVLPVAPRGFHFRYAWRNLVSACDIRNHESSSIILEALLGCATSSCEM